jgi:catechol 2,3-dioxygenase-like lactoylglutathione lyase family enzyme
MTAMKGFVEAQRDNNELLGVHSVDHFGLVVPDLKPAEHFYAASGIEPMPVENRLELRTAGSDHTWGKVTEGKRKHISYLSFGAYAEDIPRFRDHVKKLGVETIAPPAGSEGDGIWFLDHDGRPVEIKAAAKVSPDGKRQPRSAAVEPRAVPLTPAPAVRPLRLAHLILFTEDIDRAIDFYTSVLGLRLSDRAGKIIAFLHGVHGSDHHIIGFGHSDGPGLHHTSWEVDDIDAIGLGARQMLGKGYCEGWGLGRHGAGSNYFHYVRDPWKSLLEFTCDADYIPKGSTWPAGDLDMAQAVTRWGPAPPPDFIFNYELHSK